MRAFVQRRSALLAPPVFLQQAAKCSLPLLPPPPPPLPPAGCPLRRRPRHRHQQPACCASDHRRRYHGWLREEMGERSLQPRPRRPPPRGKGEARPRPPSRRGLCVLCIPRSFVRSFVRSTLSLFPSPSLRSALHMPFWAPYLTPWNGEGRTTPARPPAPLSPFSELNREVISKRKRCGSPCKRRPHKRLATPVDQSVINTRVMPKMNHPTSSMYDLEHPDFVLA